MNRFAFATVLAAGLAALLLGRPSTQQASEGPILSSKDLTITKIAPSKTRYTKDSHGNTTIEATGNPKLHAVMPSKHMILDSSAIVIHLDPEGTLKHSVLSGGVQGSLDVETKKDGLNRMTFSAPTVDYTERGVADSPAPDLDASGPVTFESANSTIGSKFLLKGSHGLFHLRSAANRELSLNEADMEGPVTFSFSGLVEGSDKKKKPANGHGTAGHLHITRGGESGTDYQLHVTGGITFNAVGGGFEIKNMKTAGATILIDQSGNVLSFAADDDATTGTISQGKRAS